MREWTHDEALPCSPEVLARAVRMVQDHHGEHASQWVAIYSIASKIGCSGETLRNWVGQAERGGGRSPHRRGQWRSFEAVEFATLEWVDWFDHRRLLEPIGNLPPAEAKAHYDAGIEDLTLAA